MRRTIILCGTLFLILFLVLPLVVVFYEALGDGVRAFVEVISAPELRDSLRLTLISVAFAVPLNVVFGVAAAWCVTKFEFRGKSLLVALIEVPFAVSPVVAGLTLVLIFGRQGWLGEWLAERDLKVIFATPGIVLATVFITVPLVARELIPLMQAQGSDEELAARSLGAAGWRIFLRVTLPNIKWGLLYGIILCTARAMGEFGAVFIVSGNYAGQATLPLYVEQLYAGQTRTMPAFAAASLLAVIGVLTLVAKTLVLGKYRSQRETSSASSHS